MPSALDSIPNSSGVSSVVNYLSSFCSAVLKNARPLSGTSHAVTSLFKPQMGPSLLSRTPPLLIAVGVLAVLGTVYLIATKIIFRKQPPFTPPGGLPGRVADVTSTAVPGSAGANGGADAGSLTPPPPTNNAAPVSADAQKTDTVTPAPVPVGANGGTGKTSLPPQPTATEGLSEKPDAVTPVLGSAGANGGADAGSLTPPPPTNNAAPVSADAQKTDTVTPAPVPVGANGGTGKTSLPPQPTATEGLSEKPDAVTPVLGSAGTNSGADAGSLTPPPPTNNAAPVSADAQKTDTVTPAPVPVGANGGTGKTSLPPQPTATEGLSEKPDAVTPVLGSAGTNSGADAGSLTPPPPTNNAAPVSADAQKTDAVTPTPSLPEQPSPSSHVKATKPSSSNPSPQTSPDSSPPGSPPSSDDDRRSSSGSVTETESRPPTPPPASTMGKLVGAVAYFFTNGRHFTKWTKYRLIQEQLELFARSKNVKPHTSEQGDSPVQNEITTAWNDLIKTLLQPTSFKTPDEQYQKTVDCLRVTWQLLNFSDAATKQKFAEQLKFVNGICCFRFAGIELFPYCKQLIEYASGEPLPANLTLATFQTELKKRTTALKSPTESTAMNPIACQKNKLKGTVNIAFDPLRGSNIPYQDGRITVNARSTLILWHGTPVEQHDPYGMLFDVFAGVLSYFPYGKNIIPDSNPVSRPPVVSADYVAFIETAGIILHVILENGKKKQFGDESGRVKARLRLAVYHPNFFALALRLDGEFFERHDEYEDIAELIQSLKERLKKQLLMPIGDFENQNMTESRITISQMEDQLAKNGFCIPKKLREACKLEENIDSLLDEVQQIYFSDKNNITTQEEHQAFLILSYVHIILFACWKMDVSILEALCKDDKDRGNVIKTILKLHFLYLTGQLNHETLTAVLTHALARPFILQKAPIINSRLVLLERVIPFIRAAHEKVPVPPTMVFGKPVETASYVVVKPPGQTIYPNNATSRTAEEYQAFLENHQPDPIPPHTGNLTFPLTQEFYKGLNQMFHTHLNEIFENRSLGISVKLDQTSLSTPGYGFSSTEGTNTGRLRYDKFFTISGGTVRYGSIKASMTITDLKPGQAQYEYSLTKG